MQILLSKYNYFQIIINFLFCFLPLSFIAGNLIINLNVILIILISLIYFGKSIIDINLLFFEKILILFFFVSLTSGIINNINFFGFNSADSNSENFFKSFAFLRYLIFYLILRKLIDDDIINYKIFFLTASICVIFVCLDLMIQLVSGKDLFGFPKTFFRAVTSF